MRWIALAFLCACGGAQRPAPAEARAVIVVRAPVATAELWLDERLVGQIGRLAGGVRTTAGGHRLELRRDGYHTRYVDVMLEAGETRVLELTLTEEQP